jgi:hypothetical protein
VAFHEMFFKLHDSWRFTMFFKHSMFRRILRDTSSHLVQLLATGLKPA